MLPPDAPDLVALDLLVSVAELGSLSRAAERHGISQPAVSLRMDQIERQVGVRLLERSPSGTRLTAVGALVVEWSQQVLVAADTMLAGVAALRADAASHVRVAASLTVADHRMPGWLVGLRHALPDVAAALEVHNSTRVIELVRAGDVELGFIEGPPVGSSGLDSREVGGDRLVVVVAPAHRWSRRRRPVDGAELAATELIVRERGSGTRQVLEDALAPWGGIRTHFELGSTAAILDAARRGEGPAVLSSLAAADDLAAGRLIDVPTEGVDLTRSFRAVWRRQDRLSAAARQLLALAG